MSNNLFDPKMYKHVHSDDKTTTLQHKRGHTIKISHNAISPKMRTALQALSKIGQEDATQDQAQEAQDQKQYGKVIMKAEGGDVEQKTFLGQTVYGTGVAKPKTPDHGGTPPGNNDQEWPLPSQTSVGKAIQEKKDSQAQGMAHGGNVETPAAPGSTPNGAYDAGLPCLNPNCKSHGRPHPNCRCYSGMADGGEVSKLRYCAHGKPHQDGCEYSNDHLNSGKGGMSTQGEMVRHKEDAKPEVKGRINMERTIRPKLAEGSGPVPYGMNESDVPKDQPQPQEQPVPVPEQPSMMLQPGMPGYEDSQKPTPEEDDDGGQTDQAMYDKIHSNDQYGRMPAEQPQQLEAQPAHNTTMQAATPAVSAPPEQPQQPPDHATDILNENKAFQQDLMNGHITPKTYNDLMFHNKDGSEKSTLGKIGSIFGLILSSAGAGLAHQPVMAMQMMDNVIKNDLDAQMKSKENAQNFFRINQARMLNEANIKNIMASTDKTEAEKAATLQGVQIKAAAQAYADMGSAAVKQIHDQINKMPEGPEKQKAAQVGLMVAQAAETNGAKAAMIAAAGINGLSMYGMNPDQNGGSQDPEAKFQNDMQARENAGDKAGADSIRERHIPGVPGLASAPVSEDMRNKFRDMNILDNKVKDVLSFAQQHKGTIDPSVRAQARQKAEELTSFYNKSVDSLGLSKGRLGWLEEQIKKNPTSLIEQLLGNNATLREIRDSNSQRGNQLKHDLGFPVSAKQPQQQEQMSKSGKPIVFRNGRWEYK